MCDTRVSEVSDVSIGELVEVSHVRLHGLALVAVDAKRVMKESMGCASPVMCWRL